MNPEVHAVSSAVRGGGMFAGHMQQPGPSPTPGLLVFKVVDVVVL